MFDYNRNDRRDRRTLVRVGRNPSALQAGGAPKTGVAPPIKTATPYRKAGP
jgi:hypothetical protein